MKKTLAATLGALLLACGFLAHLTTQAAADTNTKPFSIGDKVADFTLPDTAGKERSLASLQGSKGTVIFFTSARCPMVKAYQERLQQVTQDYQAKGINVVAINSNTTETPDEIKEQAANAKLKYVVLRDEGSKIADVFHAQVTPEMYVLDATGKLVYHGGVDDNRDAAQAKVPYLRNALDALLAGKDIERSETKAFGCSVKRAE